MAHTRGPAAPACSPTPSTMRPFFVYSRPDPRSDATLIARLALYYLLGQPWRSRCDDRPPRDDAEEYSMKSPSSRSSETKDSVGRFRPCREVAGLWKSRRQDVPSSRGHPLHPPLPNHHSRRFAISQKFRPLAARISTLPSSRIRFIRPRFSSVPSARPLPLPPSTPQPPPPPPPPALSEARYSRSSTVIDPLVYFDFVQLE